MKQIGKITALLMAAGISSFLPSSANGADAAATAGSAPAAAPAAEPVKKSPWDASIAAGLTLTSGNSDTLLATAQIQAARKWQKSDLSLGFEMGYGESDDVKNTEFYRLYGQYNQNFSDRCFGYFRAEGLKDDIADIDYRVSLSPGAGYYFIKNEKMFLRGEVGPGVVFEKQGDDSSTYATLRVAERYEWQISKTAKLWEYAEYLPQVNDWQNYIINFEVGIETVIVGNLNLRSYIQDTYDNEPAPGRKKNDLKWITALAYKF